MPKGPKVAKADTREVKPEAKTTTIIHFSFLPKARANHFLFLPREKERVLAP